MNSVICDWNTKTPSGQYTHMNIERKRVRKHTHSVGPWRSSWLGTSHTIKANMQAKQNTAQNQYQQASLLGRSTQHL